MENKGQESDNGQKNKKDRIRKAIGIFLIVAGIAAVASVFIVPAINRKNNDQDIEDIRSGKYAQPVEEATRTAVSLGGVQPVPLSSAAVEEEISERDQKMAAILADNSRIGIVEIEKIDVLYAILEGTEDEQINRAIGHLTESAGIGAAGNCVIAGHRGGYYGTFFERIPELENGDVIKLTDVNGNVYQYAVYDKKMIVPGDWSVTKPLYDEHTLTLITCEDDTRKRIVVSAVLFAP